MDSELRKIIDDVIIFHGNIVQRLTSIRTRSEPAKTAKVPPVSVKSVSVFDPIPPLPPAKKRAAPEVKKKAEKVSVPAPEPPKALPIGASSWSLSDTDESSDEAKVDRNPKQRATRPLPQVTERVPEGKRIPTKPKALDRALPRAPIAICPECDYWAPRHSSTCSRQR